MRKRISSQKQLRCSLTKHIFFKTLSPKKNTEAIGNNTILTEIKNPNDVATPFASFEIIKYWINITNYNS
ncbi:hypothetical protein NW067_04310 [Mycoplasmopsis cynos]|nr:hypothetical protein [Mycoplasmopsis cynos]UWV82238.1 hypothetical protein NW067_04310 [Mycoplasmopsis cynos]